MSANLSPGRIPTAPREVHPRRRRRRLPWARALALAWALGGTIGAARAQGGPEATDAATDAAVVEPTPEQPRVDTVSAADPGSETATGVDTGAEVTTGSGGRTPADDGARPGAAGDPAGSPDDASEGEEDDSGFSALPVVAYLPETGFVLGGYAVYSFQAPGQRRRVPSTTLPILAAVTTRGELGMEFTPEVYLGRRGQWWLSADFTGRIRNSAQYFGMGNDTRQEDEELMRQRLIGADADVLYSPVEDLFVGVATRFEWQVIDELKAGGLLERERPRGVGNAVYAGIGPAFVYDARSTTRAPRSGSFVSLTAPLHGPWLASDYTFLSVKLDARHFIHLGGEHVLAARLMAESIVGTPPFTRLPQVSGSNFMRGYIRGRFRDNHVLGAELEYRFPIYWRFSGAAFVGAAQVAPELDAFTPGGFHVAGGLGIRFALNPDERINVRLDFAMSEEGSLRPYFAPLEQF